MTEAQPPRNRLNIAHLMLWMLGTALALWLYRLAGGQREMTTGWRVYAVVYALFAGPKIGSLWLWVSHGYLRQPGFPTQPGHWLLAIEGMSTVLVFSGMAVSEWLQPYWARGAFGLMQLPNCVLTAAAYGVAYSRQRELSVPWRMVFITQMLQHVVAGLLNVVVFARAFPLWMPLPTFCVSLLLIAFLIVASLQDPLRSTRDFLHWTGCVTVLATEAIQWTLPLVIFWEFSPI